MYNDCQVLKLAPDKLGVNLQKCFTFIKTMFLHFLMFQIPQVILKPKYL